MITNETLEFFTRLVKERHQELISASQSLLISLAGENQEKKLSAAQHTLKIAIDLRAVISNNDIPSWLTDTIYQLQNFTNTHRTADLIINFVNIKPLIEKHQWIFDQNTDKSFDFDSIFEHFKNESRLPELFEQIIRILEEIESSGEVDSLTMCRALGKLIATIKKSKDGSYFSLISGWEFLLSFLNNYMWGELSNIPVLGPMFEALSQTIKETNDEMFKVHNQVQNEMVRTVTADVKILASKPSFPFITY